MKFRYPTDKEFEMAGRLYYFEYTQFYKVSPLHRELINDTNKFPSWIKAHACDAFVTEDGQGICCLTPNSDGSKKWRDEHKEIYNARMRSYRKKQKEQKQAKNTQI